jgi:hypothetical protein
VVALVALKPRDATLADAVHQLGAFHFMARPIALELIVAFAAWLWARSVEQAIARADRAEEIAAMEHVLAEQKRQLDRGIQDLLDTHVRVANGDFSARAHTSQDNVLWQIAVSLNNLLARLAKFAQVDQRLQQTEREIDRLALALENGRVGRGVIWPAPTGTRVDRLLGVVAAGVGLSGRPTRLAVGLAEQAGVQKLAGLPPVSSVRGAPIVPRTTESLSGAGVPPLPAWAAAPASAPDLLVPPPPLGAAHAQPPVGPGGWGQGQPPSSARPPQSGSVGLNGHSTLNRHTAPHPTFPPYHPGNSADRPPDHGQVAGHPPLVPQQSGAGESSADWFAGSFPHSHMPTAGYPASSAEEAQHPGSPPDHHHQAAHPTSRWPREPLPPLPPSPWPTSQAPDTDTWSSAPTGEPAAQSTSEWPAHTRDERAPTGGRAAGGSEPDLAQPEEQPDLPADPAQSGATAGSPSTGEGDGPAGAPLDGSVSADIADEWPD